MVAAGPKKKKMNEINLLRFPFSPLPEANEVMTCSVDIFDVKADYGQLPKRLMSWRCGRLPSETLNKTPQPQLFPPKKTFSSWPAFCRAL